MPEGMEKKFQNEEKPVPGGTFHLRIMNPDRMIFEGEVSKLFLQGDTGEFEILPAHYPIFSLLKKGSIIVDWEKKLDINKGIVRFFKNDCVIIAELQEDLEKREEKI